MQRGVAVLLFIACAMLFARPAAAIVGGYEPPTTSVEFDAVCALSKRSYLAPPGSINTFCSGTLIAPNLVLTARHCLQFCPSCPCTYSSNPDPNNPWMVRFRRMPDGSLGNFDVEVIQAIIDDSVCNSDTALLVLKDPVTHIDYIPVDFDFLPSAGTAAIAAGWGYNESGGVPGKLLLADVVIGASDGESIHLVPTSTRMHDSGGPVLWRDPCGMLRVVATHRGVGISGSTGQIAPLLRAMIGETPAAGCTFPSATLAYGADIRTWGTPAARVWLEADPEPAEIDHEQGSLVGAFDPDVIAGAFFVEHSVARGAGLFSTAAVECDSSMYADVYGRTEVTAEGEAKELTLAWSSDSQHTHQMVRDGKCELGGFYSQTTFGAHGTEGGISAPFEVSGQTRPWSLTAWYNREYEIIYSSWLRATAEIVVDANQNGIAESGETRLRVVQIPSTSLWWNSYASGNGSSIVEIPPGAYVLVVKVTDKVEPVYILDVGGPPVDQSMWYRAAAGVTLAPWQ